MHDRSPQPILGTPEEFVVRAVGPRSLKIVRTSSRERASLLYMWLHHTRKYDCVAVTQVKMLERYAEHPAASTPQGAR